MQLILLTIIVLVSLPHATTASWSKERVDATLLVANCINASYIALLDSLLVPLKDEALHSLYRARAFEFLSTKINRKEPLCQSLHLTAKHLYSDLRFALQTRIVLNAYEKDNAISVTQKKGLNPPDMEIQPAADHINRLLQHDDIRDACKTLVYEAGLKDHEMAAYMSRVNDCMRDKRKDAVRAHVGHKNAFGPRS